MPVISVNIPQPAIDKAKRIKLATGTSGSKLIADLILAVDEHNINFSIGKMKEDADKQATQKIKQSSTSKAPKPKICYPKIHDNMRGRYAHLFDSVGAVIPIEFYGLAESINPPVITQVLEDGSEMWSNGLFVRSDGVRVLIQEDDVVDESLIADYLDL